MVASGWRPLWRSGSDRRFARSRAHGAQCRGHRAAERNLEEAAAAFESVQLSVSHMVAEAYLLRLRGDAKLWAARACLDAQQPLHAVGAFLDAAEAYAEYFDSLFYRHTNATKRLLGQESKVTPKAEAAEDEHRHACLRAYLRAILALAARCCQESECAALLDKCEIAHVQSVLSHLRADKSAAPKAAPEMRPPAKVDASRAQGGHESASQPGVAVQEGKPTTKAAGARRRKRRGVRAKLHAGMRCRKRDGPCRIPAMRRTPAPDATEAA